MIFFEAADLDKSVESSPDLVKKLLQDCASVVTSKYSETSMLRRTTTIITTTRRANTKRTITTRTKEIRMTVVGRTLERILKMW